jgi:hypothetical protein
MEELSAQEVKTLVKLLNKCRPLGGLPDPVFVALARIVVYPAIELVLLREAAGRIEVFLTKRATNDLTWSNEYCLQGTVLRPADTSLADAMKRLLTTELGGMDAEPVYIGAYFSHSTRGAGIGFNYFLEVSEPSVKGRFFDIDNLPEMDQAHVNMLKRAATAFKKSKSAALVPAK